MIRRDGVLVRADGKLVLADGTITSPPASPPGAPTGVTATATDGQALVSFTAPPSNGFPITSYTVTSSPGGYVYTRHVEPDRRDRADQRHELHLHGHGLQRRRARSGLGPVERRHAARRADPAGHRGGRARQQAGHGQLLGLALRARSTPTR